MQDNDKKLFKLFIDSMIYAVPDNILAKHAQDSAANFYRMGLAAGFSVAELRDFSNQIESVTDDNCDSVSTVATMASDTL